jgi:hypothetical protein
MNDKWILDEIKLEFENYGEHKGKYTGRIRFRNGEHESFSFKIRPEMASPYVDLIAKDVVRGSDSLARRLCESLGIADQLQTEPVKFKSDVVEEVDPPQGEDPKPEPAPTKTSWNLFGKKDK